MIFEREIGGYFCIRTEKRWDIYAYWMRKKLFHNTECLHHFFFHVFFKHQGERRRRNWIGSRENWLGYTKHGV